MPSTDRIVLSILGRRGDSEIVWNDDDGHVTPLAHARRPSVAAGATEFSQKRKHRKLHPTTNPFEGTRQRRQRPFELDILF